MLVTIAERKSRSVARKQSAAAATTSRLRDYAVSHHGKFLIFGSTARGELRPDSDLDVLVDFPPVDERAARDFAERVALECGITPDVHLRSETSATLLERALRDAMVLG